MAACSGVMRTSRCPIDVCASAASSTMSPTWLSATGSGIVRFSPSMPKASAVSRTRSSPSSSPSWAKAVLQEIVSASISGCSPVGLQADPLKLGIDPAAVGQRELVRRGDDGLRGVPVLQCGGGHDDLEDRAGRVVLVDRLVDPGVGTRGLELVGVGADRGRVVAGELVRVVGRGAGHAQDRAGGGVEGHDGAGDALETGHRGRLHGRVQGQDDVAAGRVAPGEQVGEPAHEQPRVVAGQDVVLGALHGRCCCR